MREIERKRCAEAIRKGGHWVKVILAKRIGFCFGVKRAVRMAEEALKRNKRIYSLGSIIHNRQVVECLSRKGLKAVKTIGQIKDGPVLISSHGISPKVIAAINKKGLQVIDTTCPFVLKAQKVARRLKEEGYQVVIVGDADHPEVRALVDYAAPNVSVIKNRKEACALKIKEDSKVSVLSQTTQSAANFLDTVNGILEKKPKELRVFNTICHDADQRQTMASDLAANVDLMLIIGGRNSANTRRLFDVCRKLQKNSRLIENDSELREAWFNNKVRVVGVASGASTPGQAVQSVVNKIHRKGVV
ncbi:MAG: 4-hydroxy-3-methylbut-2-enyl diphosphate reductase [Candidatus Omnitrophica bacterium]|nr:4-hydroxy-3-methylbut-2-enyl diphosphate reductase [Candidatus Omnitrophota bacterium]